LHRAKICTVHAQTEISFGGETLILSTLRTAYHQDSASLIISDLHLGKTTHFRKNALPIPKEAMLTDFHNLQQALNHFKPMRVFFLGDLFHSTWNEEWDLFVNLMKNYPLLQKLLIAGNHDILKPDKYEAAEMVVLDRYQLNNITLLHDAESEDCLYSISGHIHPGFKISGAGKQSMVLPCFYVGQSKMIMPAFGSLTGKMAMKKLNENDRAWCFYNNRFYPC